MITEENKNISRQIPELTDSKGVAIATIIRCMKQAVLPFNNARSQTNLLCTLNENQFTQIYVEQIGIQIKPYPIGVLNQYSDIFRGTKGFPDFYFYKMEEGVTHEPLFVVESKRLTNSLPKSRKQEYVKGNNNNGGIERYKKEIHGNGLTECGMLGFVEKETFVFWIQKINTWITDLSTLMPDTWKTDENLTEIENKESFMLLNSIAHRTSQQDICLHHLWINIQ